MTKDQIRKFIRRANGEVSQSERLRAAIEVFSSIEKSHTFASAHCIALYADLPDEIPTTEAITHYTALGKRILLPRVTGDTTMEFFDIAQTKLSVGAFGIEEPQGDVAVDPSEIDLMVVPAVALCYDGRRLGRGRGYYDRYLAREEVKAHTIGVGYYHQLLNYIPCFEYDITLNEVITPLFEGRDITLPSLILSTLDSAGIDANRLSFGISRLNSMGLSWVLLRYSMQIYRAPIPGEKINVETWIGAFSRVASTRNFHLLSESGELLGEASSQWCMIDLKTRRVADIATSGVEYSQHIQHRDINIEMPRRIASIDEAKEIQTTTHLVTEEDLDFNNHVNTIRYIEMILNTLPPEEQSAINNKRIDIQFISEARLNEQLTIKHQNNTTFEITHPDGTTAVKCALSVLSGVV